MSIENIPRDCENHSGIAAVAECAVCGKPVCGDCMITADGKCLCSDTFHRTVLLDYSLLGSCATPFEADLVGTNLRSHGIKNYSFDPKQYHGNSAVRIYVEHGSAQKSAQLLAELDLADFIILASYGKQIL